jgi:hypothetical protein
MKETIQKTITKDRNDGYSKKNKKESINCSVIFVTVTKVIDPLSVVDEDVLSVDDGLKKKSEGGVLGWG